MPFGKGMISLVFGVITCYLEKCFFTGMSQWLAERTVIEKHLGKAIELSYYSGSINSKKDDTHYQS